MQMSFWFERQRHPYSSVGLIIYLCVIIFYVFHVLFFIYLSRPLKNEDFESISKEIEEVFPTETRITLYSACSKKTLEAQ